MTPFWQIVGNLEGVNKSDCNPASNLEASAEIIGLRSVRNGNRNDNSGLELLPEALFFTTPTSISEIFNCWFINDYVIVLSDPN